MKIVLSSNPYRDKGLRAALEAKRVLEHAGAKTVMCLPFQPKKGDRLDLPRQLPLSQLDKEYMKRLNGYLEQGNPLPWGEEEEE